MTTELPPNGDQARPSPIELQSQLQELCGLLPYDINKDMSRFFRTLTTREEIIEGIKTEGETLRNEWKSTLQRRQRGELKEIFMRRLTWLMQFADVTPTFKKRIMEEFKGEYDYGVREVEEGEEDNIQRLLNLTADSNSRITITIFDIEGAKTIEQKAYNLELEMYLSEFEIAKEENREPSLNENQDQTLAQWRLEFIEKYGDEP